MTTNKAICTALAIPAIIVASFISMAQKPVSAVSTRTENLEITTLIKSEKLNREKILKEFFKKNKSPLEEHAGVFVEVADKYNLDYRLLPAISCTESSCGKKLIPESYNPFGWGIYGTKVTRFKSYSEAIEIVGKGISKNYVAKGYDTVEKIMPIYTPSSKTWAKNTRSFMNQMDKIAFSDK